MSLDIISIQPVISSFIIFTSASLVISKYYEDYLVSSFDKFKDKIKGKKLPKYSSAPIPQNIRDMHDEIINQNPNKLGEIALWFFYLLFAIILLEETFILSQAYGFANHHIELLCNFMMWVSVLVGLVTCSPSMYQFKLEYYSGL